MSDVKPGGVINARERPRVLIMCNDASLRRQVSEWADGRPGTFKPIEAMDEVRPAEWDALITDDRTMTYHASTWGDDQSWPLVSRHLNVFRVLNEIDEHISNGYLDAIPHPSDKEFAPAIVAAKSGIRGHEMTRMDSLPEKVQDLVTTHLLPACEDRPTQFGLRVQDSVDGDIPNFRFRPLLLAPDGTAVAASYRRPDKASWWIVPVDVPSISAWLELAFDDWRELDPSRFPGDPGWLDSPTWHSSAEAEVAGKIQAKQTEYDEATSRIEAELGSLRAELDKASREARNGRKRLLYEQDDPLQSAVLEALVALGFDVRDMDAEWADRERREDFRITDSEEPDWIAIADATGVTKGAKSSKFTAVGGYANKYILEVGATTAPSQWVITNRLIERDPNTRGELFRSDDVEVFAESKGLAIDSVAIYLFVENVTTAEKQRMLRKWLRARTGEVTIADARAWIEANG